MDHKFEETKNKIHQMDMLKKHSDLEVQKRKGVIDVSTAAAKGAVAIDTARKLAAVKVEKAREPAE